MAEAIPARNLRFRIRRDASGLFSWFRQNWREKRWFRLTGYALGAFLVMMLLLWLVVLRSLPSADKLLTYQPPLPTMVRGVDGQLVYSYARERRVQLRFVDFPKPLVDAMLSAEDKTFWSHGGVDYTGLAGAVIDYISKIGSDERAKGGSTITQQVAKNVLIGNEYSIGRKLKEMLVARRIEDVLNKQQILELYLNEIPLGRQSFGVQAASRAYFDKDVGELQLHEAAFLAILPKAPETYGRAKNAGVAVERRNWVLDQMVKNGWATSEQAEVAKAQPLGLQPRRAESWDPSVGYFVEEARRRLIARFGETAESGPNSVYAGGLWVRTSLDPQMQKAAQDALRAGLLRYHSGKGWRGPIAHINLDPGKWQSQLLALNKSISYQDWRVGVVVQRSGPGGSIGFADGTTAGLTAMPDTLRAGDVIAAAPVNSRLYAVRTIPEVSGGMLVQSPTDGRILAMQGGFDAGLGSFNRATQALRQPGSTIKPFVYATGLDFGMTPATMVLDGQFCVWSGAKIGRKCFQNFGGGGGSGNHTMRWGLEQSRNLMTVRIASDSGMENVANAIERVGIGKYDPYLSVALGSGDTTVAQMVNAYSALANNGIQYDATLDRLRPGPHRQDHLARRYAEVHRLQHAAMGWQADAAARPARQAGARSAHRLPDRAHARGCHHARHRGGAPGPRSAAVRQDRHHHRANQCLVRRRLAALRRRGLYRLRSAALARRLCPGRHFRGADFQAARPGDQAALGPDSVRRPGRCPHGQDRPHFGQARVRRHAGRRSQGLADLGGFQGRHRTQAHRARRRVRGQARRADRHAAPWQCAGPGAGGGEPAPGAFRTRRLCRGAGRHLLGRGSAPPALHPLLTGRRSAARGAR